MSKIREVGTAYWNLGIYTKFKNKYEHDPNLFKIKANIGGEVLEIPVNDIINNQINLYLAKKININTQIVDGNTEIMDIILKH